MDGQLLENTVELVESMSGAKAFVVVNDFKSYAGRNVTIKRFVKNGTDGLVTEIVDRLRRGEKVVSHINSLKALRVVEAAIQDEFGSQKTIITYHGENRDVETLEDGTQVYHEQRKREEL